MGMSNAAVFIKLADSKKYKVDNIINHLFGKFENISNLRTEGFGFRKPNYVLVSYHQNGLIIRNAQFINEVLVKRNRELIKRIYDFFDKPEVILTYMHYDSGGSFGFFISKMEKLPDFDIL